MPRDPIKWLTYHPDQTLCAALFVGQLSIRLVGFEYLFQPGMKLRSVFVMTKCSNILPCFK